ncbi:ABC transporter ATP-binding protein [Lactonifactor longoviformis]|nr:ABC transporter ATP-binding protein [Lactonifactor longoviformis]
MEGREVLMMGNNREVKVEVKNLTKKFDDLLVLNDISFNIRKGEFVCVVGPTGCGKTTFLNLLTKLIEPTSGELLIDGEPADPKKHNLAFVFQEPSAFQWLTVEENLAFGLKIKKLPPDEIKRRVDNMLELLGLTKFRNAYPSQLSVSSEQRIIIGRAFVMNPDLLLMDEPYGQMDIKLRYYLEDEVIRLWKETGSTVVFITHNIEEAVYLAEKVLILTNKPATIKEEIEVELPRPRDFTDPAFIQLRTHITDQIKWW